MTLLLEQEVEETFPFDCEAVIGAVVKEALRAEQCPYECEVNVTLTDNDRIQGLNAQFRGIDAPTDVLSFPMVDYEQAGEFSHLELPMAKQQYFNLETGELLLGDIVISVERAKAQAEAYGHSQKRELAFLTAHSMLHLMGYDHMEDEERLVMEQKQEQILQEIGITRNGD